MRENRLKVIGTRIRAASKIKITQSREHDVLLVPFRILFSLLFVLVDICKFVASTIEWLPKLKKPKAESTAKKGIDAALDGLE